MAGAKRRITVEGNFRDVIRETQKAEKELDDVGESALTMGEASEKGFKKVAVGAEIAEEAIEDVKHEALQLTTVLAALDTKMGAYNQRFGQLRGVNRQLRAAHSGAPGFNKSTGKPLRKFRVRDLDSGKFSTVLAATISDAIHSQMSAAHRRSVPKSRIAKSVGHGGRERADFSDSGLGYNLRAYGELPYLADAGRTAEKQAKRRQRGLMSAKNVSSGVSPREKGESIENFMAREYGHVKSERRLGRAMRGAASNTDLRFVHSNLDSGVTKADLAQAARAFAQTAVVTPVAAPKRGGKRTKVPKVGTLSKSPTTDFPSVQRSLPTTDFPSVQSATSKKTKTKKPKSVKQEMADLDAHFDALVDEADLDESVFGASYEERALDELEGNNETRRHADKLAREADKIEDADKRQKKLDEAQEKYDELLAKEAEEEAEFRTQEVERREAEHRAKKRKHERRIADRQRARRRRKDRQRVSRVSPSRVVADRPSLRSAVLSKFEERLERLRSRGGKLQGVLDTSRAAQSATSLAGGGSRKFSILDYSELDPETGSPSLRGVVTSDSASAAVGSYLKDGGGPDVDRVDVPVTSNLRDGGTKARMFDRLRGGYIEAYSVPDPDTPIGKAQTVAAEAADARGRTPGFVPVTRSTGGFSGSGKSMGGKDNDASIEGARSVQTPSKFTSDLDVVSQEREYVDREIRKLEQLRDSVAEGDENALTQASRRFGIYQQPTEAQRADQRRLGEAIRGTNRDLAVENLSTRLSNYATRKRVIESALASGVNSEELMDAATFGHAREFDPGVWTDGGRKKKGQTKTEREYIPHREFVKVNPKTGNRRYLTNLTPDDDAQMRLQLERELAHIQQVYDRDYNSLDRIVSGESTPEAEGLRDQIRNRESVYYPDQSSRAQRVDLGVPDDYEWQDPVGREQRRIAGLRSGVMADRQHSFPTGQVVGRGAATPVARPSGTSNVATEVLDEMIVEETLEDAAKRAEKEAHDKIIREQHLDRFQKAEEAKKADAEAQKVRPVDKPVEGAKAAPSPTVVQPGSGPKSGISDSPTEALERAAKNSEDRANKVDKTATKTAATQKKTADNDKKTSTKKAATAKKEAKTAKKTASTAKRAEKTSKEDKDTSKENKKTAAKKASTAKKEAKTAKKESSTATKNEKSAAKKPGKAAAVRGGKKPDVSVGDNVIDASDWDDFDFDDTAGMYEAISDDIAEDIEDTREKLDKDADSSRLPPATATASKGAAKENEKAADTDKKAAKKAADTSKKKADTAKKDAGTAKKTEDTAKKNEKVATKTADTADKDARTAKKDADTAKTRQRGSRAVGPSRSPARRGVDKELVRDRKRLRLLQSVMGGMAAEMRDDGFDPYWIRNITEDYWEVDTVDAIDSEDALRRRFPDASDKSHKRLPDIGGRGRAEHVDKGTGDVWRAYRPSFGSESGDRSFRGRDGKRVTHDFKHIFNRFRKVVSEAKVIDSSRFADALDPHAVAQQARVEIDTLKDRIRLQENRIPKDKSEKSSTEKKAARDSKKVEKEQKKSDKSTKSNTSAVKDNTKAVEEGTKASKAPTVVKSGTADKPVKEVEKAAKEVEKSSKDQAKTARKDAADRKKADKKGASAAPAVVDGGSSPAEKVADETKDASKRTSTASEKVAEETKKNTKAVEENTKSTKPPAAATTTTKKASEKKAAKKPEKKAEPKKASIDGEKVTKESTKATKAGTKATKENTKQASKSTDASKKQTKATKAASASSNKAAKKSTKQASKSTEATKKQTKATKAATPRKPTVVQPRLADATPVAPTKRKGIQIRPVMTGYTPLPRPEFDGPPADKNEAARRARAVKKYNELETIRKSEHIRPQLDEMLHRAELAQRAREADSSLSQRQRIEAKKLANQFKKLRMELSEIDLDKGARATRVREAQRIGRMFNQLPDMLTSAKMDPHDLRLTGGRRFVKPPLALPAAGDTTPDTRLHPTFMAPQEVADRKGAQLRADSDRRLAGRANAILAVEAMIDELRKHQLADEEKINKRLDARERTLRNIAQWRAGAARDAQLAVEQAAEEARLADKARRAASPRMYRLRDRAAQSKFVPAFMKPGAQEGAMFNALRKKADGEERGFWSRMVRSDLTRVRGGAAGMHTPAGGVATLGGALGATTGKLGRFNAEMVKATNRLGVFRYGFAATTAAVGLLALGLGALGVTFNAEMESLTIGFEAMLKSGVKAKDLIDRIIETSAVTPFRVGDLAQATRLLMAGGVDPETILSGAGKEATGYLVDIGNAVAAMGGGQDVFRGVARAIGQIASKGKASAEELRQLAERGIPAYDILRVELGLTGKEVAQIGDYAISAERTLAALSKGFQERFGGAMEKQAQTLRGVLTTVIDNISIVSGNMFRGVFEGLRGEARSAASILLELNQLASFASFSTAIERLFPDAAPILLQITGVAKEFLNTVKSLSPVLGGVSGAMGSIGNALDAALIPFQVFNSIISNIPNPLLSFLGIMVALSVTTKTFLGSSAFLAKALFGVGKAAFKASSGFTRLMQATIASTLAYKAHGAAAARAAFGMHMGMNSMKVASMAASGLMVGALALTAAAVVAFRAFRKETVNLADGFITASEGAEILAKSTHTAVEATSSIEAVWSGKKAKFLEENKDVIRQIRELDSEGRQDYLFALGVQLRLANPEKSIEEIQNEIDHLAHTAVFGLRLDIDFSESQLEDVRKVASDSINDITRDLKKEWDEDGALKRAMDAAANQYDGVRAIRGGGIATEAALQNPENEAMRAAVLRQLDVGDITADKLEDFATLMSQLFQDEPIEALRFMEQLEGVVGENSAAMAVLNKELAYLLNFDYKDFKEGGRTLKDLVMTMISSPSTRVTGESMMEMFAWAMQKYPEDELPLDEYLEALMLISNVEEVVEDTNDDLEDMKKRAQAAAKALQDAIAALSSNFSSYIDPMQSIQMVMSDVSKEAQKAAGDLARAAGLPASRWQEFIFLLDDGPAYLTKMIATQEVLNNRTRDFANNMEKLTAGYEFSHPDAIAWLQAKGTPGMVEELVRRMESGTTEDYNYLRDAMDILSDSQQIPDAAASAVSNSLRTLAEAVARDFSHLGEETKEAILKVIEDWDTYVQQLEDAFDREIDVNVRLANGELLFSTKPGPPPELAGNRFDNIDGYLNTLYDFMHDLGDFESALPGLTKASKLDPNAKQTAFDTYMDQIVSALKADPEFASGLTTENIASIREIVNRMVNNADGRPMSFEAVWQVLVEGKEFEDVVLPGMIVTVPDELSGSIQSATTDALVAASKDPQVIQTLEDLFGDTFTNATKSGRSKTGRSKPGGQPGPGHVDVGGRRGGRTPQGRVPGIDGRRGRNFGTSVGGFGESRVDRTPLAVDKEVSKFKLWRQMWDAAHSPEATAWDAMEMTSQFGGRLGAWETSFHDGALEAILADLHRMNFDWQDIGDELWDQWWEQGTVDWRTVPPHAPAIKRYGMTSGAAAYLDDPKTSFGGYGESRVDRTPQVSWGGFGESRVDRTPLKDLGDAYADLDNLRRALSDLRKPVGGDPYAGLGNLDDVLTQLRKPLEDGGLSGLTRTLGVGFTEGMEEGAQAWIGTDPFAWIREDIAEKANRGLAEGFVKSKRAISLTEKLEDYPFAINVSTLDAPLSALERLKEKLEDYPLNVNISTLDSPPSALEKLKEKLEDYPFKVNVSTLDAPPSAFEKLKKRLEDYPFAINISTLDAPLSALDKLKQKLEDYPFAMNISTLDSPPSALERLKQKLEDYPFAMHISTLDVPLSALEKLQQKLADYPFAMHVELQPYVRPGVQGIDWGGTDGLAWALGDWSTDFEGWVEQFNNVLEKTTKFEPPKWLSDTSNEVDKIAENQKRWNYEQANTINRLYIIRDELRKVKMFSDEWMSLKGQEASEIKVLWGDTDNAHQRLNDLLDQAEEYEEQIADLQDQQTKRTKQFNDEKERIQKDFDDRMIENQISLEDRLYDMKKNHNDRIKDLQDQLNDEISSNAEQIFESLNPREQFEGSWANSLKALQTNLDAQNVIFQESKDAIDALREMGLEDKVLDLFDLGTPQAANQLKRLVKELEGDPAAVARLNAAAKTRLDIAKEMARIEGQERIEHIEKELQKERDALAAIETAQQEHDARMAAWDLLSNEQKIANLEEWIETQRQARTDIGDLWRGYYEQMLSAEETRQESLQDVNDRYIEEMDDLKERLTEVKEDLAELGLDTGRSFGEALAEGLASKYPGILQAARDFRDALIAEFEGMNIAGLTQRSETKDALKTFDLAMAGETRLDFAKRLFRTFHNREAADDNEAKKWVDSAGIYRKSSEYSWDSVMPISHKSVATQRALDLGMLAHILNMQTNPGSGISGGDGSTDGKTDDDEATGKGTTNIGNANDQKLGSTGKVALTRWEYVVKAFKSVGQDLQEIADESNVPLKQVAKNWGVTSGLIRNTVDHKWDDLITKDHKELVDARVKETMMPGYKRSKETEEAGDDFLAGLDVKYHTGLNTAMGAPRVDEFYATLQKGEVVLSKSQVGTLDGILGKGGGDGEKTLNVVLMAPDGRVLWDVTKPYRDEDEIVEAVMRGG